MNILLNILSCYKYNIAEWLIKQNEIEKVYIPYISSLYQEKSSEELPEGVFFWPLEKMMSEGIESFEVVINTEPLDEETLNKARTFESTFINLDSKKYTLPIGTYEESKRRYLLLLRYWKTFFVEYGVDFVLYDDVPHWPPIYASYAMAQSIGVETCILAPVGIREPGVDGYYCFSGDSLETIGIDIENYYTSILECGNDVVLSGVIGRYFEKSTNRKSEASLKPSDRKRWLRYVRKAKYSTPNVAFPEVYAIAHNFFYFSSAIIKHHSFEAYESKKYGIKDIRDLKRYHLHMKYDIFTLDEYDKKAQLPNFNERYILFPIQLTPEATTTPLAGAFCDQFTSIQLLAHIAKNYGIKIYVKEYYLQPFRGKVFWEELNKIDNIVFIKSCVSSGELMEHALAVANQTGTCLLEAPFYGKPAIAIGKGYCFKGMPGLYEISDIPNGKKVIEKVLKGTVIDLNNLKKYYYAIEKNAVFFHRDPLGKVDNTSSEYAKTEEELKTFLRKKLGLNMSS